MPARRRWSALGGAIVALCFVALPACGADGTTSVAPAATSLSAPGSTGVDITLKDFAIASSVTTAPDGQVDFTVTNQGPDETHEFVVIKTELDLLSLPTNQDGSVDEEGPGLEPVDEVEDVTVGSTDDLTVNLGPGSYVFICNIVQKQPDGTTVSHYAEGMRAAFTVG